jgi:hypothetical protein
VQCCDDGQTTMSQLNSRLAQWELFYQVVNYVIVIEFCHSLHSPGTVYWRCSATSFNVYIYIYMLQNAHDDRGKVIAALQQKLTELASLFEVCVYLHLNLANLYVFFMINNVVITYCRMVLWMSNNGQTKLGNCRTKCSRSLFHCRFVRVHEPITYLSKSVRIL